MALWLQPASVLFSYACTAVNLHLAIPVLLLSWLHTLNGRPQCTQCGCGACSTHASALWLLIASALLALTVPAPHLAPPSAPPSNSIRSRVGTSLVCPGPPTTHAYWRRLFSSVLPTLSLAVARQVEWWWRRLTYAMVGWLPNASWPPKCRRPCRGSPGTRPLLMQPSRPVLKMSTFTLMHQVCNV